MGAEPKLKGLLPLVSGAAVVAGAAVLSFSPGRFVCAGAGVPPSLKPEKVGAEFVVVEEVVDAEVAGALPKLNPPPPPPPPPLLPGCPAVEVLEAPVVEGGAGGFPNENPVEVAEAEEDAGTAGALLPKLKELPPPPAAAGA